MTGRPQSAAAAFAAAALVSLIGCSSSGADDPDAAKSALPAGGIPCASAAAARTVKLPAAFPAAFPLPPGSKVYAVDDRGSGGIVVSAVTSASFAQTLHSLQKELPAAGFTPDHGEVEPDDAESDWRSSAYQGRWAIRALDACGGDTAVSVVARRLG